MEWFEKLPDKCPPEDAVEPNHEVFYRITKGSQVTNTDFFSQQKEDPSKVFIGEGIDECITRAVSVFRIKKDAQKKIHLPKFKGGYIAEITLDKKDGLIKKTFSKSHFSWWRSQYFDITCAKIITDE